jgi:phytoene synthase
VRDGSARTARRILARSSKSFAFAGRLLPAGCRRDATALYAWCRRCDDAVDGPTEVPSRAAAVMHLRAELDRVYDPSGDISEAADPVLAGFQRVVRRRSIPRRYAEDLVAGMAMDVDRVRYQTFDDLLLYCYRVAGTVGLMMAHSMGVRSPAALRRAADLGIAMQLTNICRDVVEDQRRDRVYLPQSWLAVVRAQTGDDDEVRPVVAELLRRAEGFYRSGDEGMAALPLGCVVAIRAARLIYAEIGRQIARRGFDVHAGRAVVSRGRKAWLALRALATTLWSRRRPNDAVSIRGDHTEHHPQPLPFELPIGPATERPGSAWASGARS